MASPSKSLNSPKQVDYLKKNLSLLECLSKAPSTHWLATLSTAKTLPLYFLLIKETDPETWTIVFQEYLSKSVRSGSVSKETSLSFVALNTLPSDVVSL